MDPSALKILIVDDCQSVRHLLSVWLTEEGYSVDVVPDAEQAIAWIERDVPHILISDWVMPGMSGVELCGWVRSQDLPHYVYMLIFTAHSGAQNSVTALEAGADDFVYKPVDRAELLARIRAGARLVEMQRRVSEAARTDPLTGLANRRTLFDFLEREWARSHRYHIPLACAMLDIDFFKRVNDTYGHAKGDEVLRRVAAILKDNCRNSDVVGRYGGEEFCILLPETDEPSAMIWADRVRIKIAAAGIGIPGDTLHLTASLGVAERLIDNRQPADMIDLADQALLVAKRSGRDRVVSYSAVQDSTRFAPGGPSAIFDGLVARDVMAGNIPSLHEDATIYQAARHFLQLRFNSAPIVDSVGRLSGILSERDVMATMLWPQWWSLPIRDAMKRNVVCYEETTPVALIYDFLCRVSLRSVVVVHEGRPTGMISRGSVLRWFLHRLSMSDQASGNLPLSNELRAGLRMLPNEQQESIQRLAHVVAGEASELERQLTLRQGDMTPWVLSGVSRLEELLQSLLTCARAIHSSQKYRGSKRP